MQILKAVILPAAGITIIIFAVYCWSWKQPACFLNVEDTGSINAASFDPGRAVDNKNLIILADGKSTNSIEYSVQQLEEKWSSVNPDVVLIDGKLGFLLPGLMDPVKKFGLAGKARELAIKNNVEVFSYNLPEDKIVEKLLNRYPAGQIALAMVLGEYYNNLKEAKNISRESILRDCIYNNRFASANGRIKSVRDVDQIWEKDFSKLKNWRDTNGLPGYAGEIGIEINQIKQKHYINLINHFLDSNKKVFVVGSPVSSANTAISR